GRCLLHLLAERHGIVAGVRTVVPDDLQLVAAVDRTAGVARDHRDTADWHELRWPGPASDLHHLLHTRDLEGFGGVERYELAANHRWTRDHRELHAGDLCIDPVGRLSRGDIVQIDNRDRPGADIAEVARVFQLQAVRCRRRQSTRRLRQFAIAQHVTRTE